MNLCIPKIALEANNWMNLCLANDTIDYQKVKKKKILVIYFINKGIEKQNFDIMCITVNTVVKFHGEAVEI